MLHTHKVAGSNPARNIIFAYFPYYLPGQVCSALGFYGVMVSTLDFESRDPSSNLGRTYGHLTPWRNGSASDSRSEGCVFESRRGHNNFVYIIYTYIYYDISDCIDIELKKMETIIKHIFISDSSTFHLIRRGKYFASNED